MFRTSLRTCADPKHTRLYLHKHKRRYKHKRLYFRPLLPDFLPSQTPPPFLLPFNST
jgi:hypothetical protein